MVVIAVVMLLIVGSALTLVGVIAYPGRGRELSQAPVINDLLVKVAERTGVDRTPVGRD